MLATSFPVHVVSHIHVPSRCFPSSRPSGLDFVFHMFFLIKYSKSLEEGGRGRGWASVGGGRRGGLGLWLRFAAGAGVGAGDTPLNFGPPTPHVNDHRKPIHPQPLGFIRGGSRCTALASVFNLSAPSSTRT